jgi:prepilin-type N-terminal cleavage/methylation domain-containing protein
MTESRGFTLLEVLLAMTALALVTAICYGAFHLGVRAVERGEVAVVSAQRLRVASDVLTRQIKSTVPYAARNRDEDIYPYFFGTATSMTFITAAGLDGGGGLARVVYQVVDGPPRLVLTESAFFSPDGLGRDAVDKPGERSAILLDGFRTLKFEYMMNDGVDTEWRAGWDGHEEEALPAAVRIMVDGIPGLEVDRWGQEIPIMATLYGENGNELGEEAELLADTASGDEEDGDDGSSGKSQAGADGEEADDE